MYSVLALKYSLLIYIKYKQTRCTIQRKNKEKLESTFNSYVYIDVYKLFIYINISCNRLSRGRQTDRQTSDRQTERQTDRQTDGHTDRHLFKTSFIFVGMFGVLCLDLTWGNSEHLSILLKTVSISSLTLFDVCASSFFSFKKSIRGSSMAEVKVFHNASTSGGTMETLPILLEYNTFRSVSESGSDETTMHQEQLLKISFCTDIKNKHQMNLILLYFCK